MSRLVNHIDYALACGRLAPQFRPDDVLRACPGWTYHTVRVLLPKHRRGNPGGHEVFFERNPDGTYSRASSLDRVADSHEARRQRARERAAEAAL